MVSKTVEDFPSRAKDCSATLNERIRMARHFAGLSQAALAECSAVTPSAVAQWEHPSGTRPALTRLRLVAKALDVPIDWLLSGGKLKRSTAIDSGEPEPPAVILDVYAQTTQEEELLSAFRRMGYRAQEHLLALAREFPAAGRGGKRLQPR